MRMGNLLYVENSWPCNRPFLHKETMSFFFYQFDEGSNFSTFVALNRQRNFRKTQVIY